MKKIFVIVALTAVACGTSRKITRDPNFTSEEIQTAMTEQEGPEYTKEQLKGAIRSDLFATRGLTHLLAKWGLELRSKQPACSAFFINDKGIPGDLAINVFETLTDEDFATSPYFNPGYLQDVNKFCPAFDKLRREDRIVFWVYVFQNLAFKESTCNPKAENWSKAVPNPPAVGLLQLEQRKDLRAWRGPACAVPTDQIKAPINQLKCAVSIMSKQLKNTKNLYGKSVVSKAGKPILSYWHGLNLGNDVWKAVSKKLSEFPPCGAE